MAQKLRPFRPVTPGVRTPLVEGLMESEGGTFTHGATWGGHPVSMAATIANVTAMQDEKVVENCANNEAYFRSKLDDLAASADSPAP